MSVRTERVASVIKHELGSVISKTCNGSGLGFTTVTEVQVTPDLKLAKIYISIFGSKEVQEKTLSYLEDEKRHFRSVLASSVNLKFTPALQFYQDTTMDRVDSLERLIKKIHNNDR
jgi:ribosome-binding factor A